MDDLEDEMALDEEQASPVTLPRAQNLLSLVSCACSFSDSVLQCPVFAVPMHHWQIFEGYMEMADI